LLVQIKIQFFNCSILIVQTMCCTNLKLDYSVDQSQLIPKLNCVKSLEFFIQWGGVIFIFREIQYAYFWNQREQFPTRKNTMLLFRPTSNFDSTMNFFLKFFNLHGPFARGRSQNFKKYYNKIFVFIIIHNF
jgi:hypothetical protein